MSVVEVRHFDVVLDVDVLDLNLSITPCDRPTVPASQTCSGKSHTRTSFPSSCWPGNLREATCLSPHSSDSRSRLRPRPSKRTGDSEIRLLNAKVERLAHNLTNKLEDIAREVNIIKENKPYSILILENAVNDLNQEKHELSKKNDDLREVSMTLSYTISDLKLANKNLESEKASLLTALKLIQDDYTQMTNKTSAANQNYCSTVRLDDETTRKSSKSERTHGTNNIGKEQSSSGYVEPSHNPYQVLSHHDDDSKNSTNTANVSESEQPDQTVSRLVNDETGVLSETKAHSVKEKTASQSKSHVNVAIVGDSMLKYINSGRLRKSLNQNLLIKTFPGAKVANMQHYVKPTMAHAPECLILHVGTNDLKESSSRQISTSIANLGLEIKKKLPKTKLMISEIIMRKDDPQINMLKKSTPSYRRYAPIIIGDL